MPLPDNNDESKKVLLKTTLLLVAITINALELFLPRIPFLPWLKPGLANCVTIVWIIQFGCVDALLFSFLRICVVGFYTGFSFVTISLSLSGAVLATCVMSLSWHVLGRRNLIGIIGIAILGALFHNLGQIIAVFFIITTNIYLFYQIPFMFIASIIFGSFVGVLVPMLAGLAFHVTERIHENPVTLPDNPLISRVSVMICIAVLILSISLMFIDSMMILSGIAILITIIVQILSAGSLEAFLFPIRRFWLIFLFVACLHLFTPYGKRIDIMPWLTYEGVDAALKQWLRLWTWLELSFIFKYFKFHTFVFRTLNFLFKPYESTIYAGLLAVEDFSGVFELIRKRVVLEFMTMLRHPLITSREAFGRVFNDISEYIIQRHQQAVKDEKSLEPTGLN